MKHFIPYGKQFIDNRDKKSVKLSLTKDLISSGPFVEKFETKLKKYFNSKFSFVCSSGTAAIHLAMMSLDLKKGDVVLMPAINFIASYNVAKIMQLKVCLVDVDEYSGQMTPEKVLNSIKKYNLKKIKALILMYHGGYPENIKKFNDIKKKYNFFIIEDACHALGSEYKFNNKYLKVGSCKHSDICTFSLHPVKTITSGEGGIISTNNFKIANKLKLLRSHGIIKDKKKYWKYDVLQHGLNYRLSDINCALGLSQLKKINFFLKKRKKIYSKYLADFNNFNSFLKIPIYSKNIKSSYHLFILHIIFQKIKKNKDDFLRYLNKNNILGQYHYIPIYKFSCYREKKTNFPGSEKYFKNSVSIPIYVKLGMKNQRKIIQIIKNYFKKN